MIIIINSAGAAKKEIHSKKQQISANKVHEIHPFHTQTIISSLSQL